MGAAEQLPLLPEFAPTQRDRWARIRVLISDIAARMGPKTFAGAIGVTHSSLSNALAGRDRHRLPGEAILLALELAPNDDLLAELAAIRQRGVHRVRQPDDAEQLEDLRAALDESLGADCKMIILAQGLRYAIAAGGQAPGAGAQLEGLRRALDEALSPDLFLLVLGKARRRGPRRADGTPGASAPPELRRPPLPRREP